MASTDASNQFADLISRREVVVCVGSGGVGKTTTSAVIALHAALEGRKALVLTIDPAKRLANSLGVDALDNEPTRIPIDRFEEVGLEPKGELWAMMLDMKKSFDSLNLSILVEEARATGFPLKRSPYHWQCTTRRED